MFTYTVGICFEVGSHIDRKLVPMLSIMMLVISVYGTHINVDDPSPCITSLLLVIQFGFHLSKTFLSLTVHIVLIFHFSYVQNFSVQMITLFQSQIENISWAHYNMLQVLSCWSTISYLLGNVVENLSNYFIHIFFLLLQVTIPLGDIDEV